MKFIHTVVIGDWSKDGHNQSDNFSFECTHDETEVKTAYLAAVKACKVSLHHEAKGAVVVCERYQDNLIKPEQLSNLKELGVNFSGFEGSTKDGGMYCGPQNIAKIFMEMVKSQIDGFKYNAVEQPKPINGWWSKDFNYGFGYGVYDY